MPVQQTKKRVYLILVSILLLWKVGSGFQSSCGPMEWLASVCEFVQKKFLWNAPIRQKRINIFLPECHQAASSLTPRVGTSSRINIGKHCFSDYAIRRMLRLDILIISPHSLSAV